MEQILTANNNKVDAVVASNDGTAGGVVAALTAQGMEGIPVSGQDGDFAALNRVAKGLQTVSVWKDARELGKAAAKIAIDLAKGNASRQDRRRDQVQRWSEEADDGCGAVEAGTDPLGQPQPRHRRRLGQQGSGVPGRDQERSACM